MDNNAKTYIIGTTLAVLSVLLIWLLLMGFTADYNTEPITDQSFNADANLEEEERLEQLQRENAESELFSDAYAATRDQNRRSDVNTIATALSVYIANGGNIARFGSLPICNNSYPIGTGPGMIDLSSLVPDYLSSIPSDPMEQEENNSGYEICITTENNIKISAPNAEIINEVKVEF